MAAGRIHVCSAGFSFALWFLVFYSRLIIRKSTEKDIAYARRPVEGFQFAAWKFFKPSISQPSDTSENHRFVPTRHCNFNSSRGFITGLLLLCGDDISQPGPTITKRTQNGGSSVPLKGLVINTRSMKSQHKVGTSRVNNLDRIQDLDCSEHADIVLISETWLNCNILDPELFPLSDFIIYRKDRKDRNGGEVLIAAKASSFKSMREYVPNSENLEDLELVCAEITTFACYADDTKIFKSIDSITDCNALQSDLNDLVSWSESSGLIFNQSKCKYQCITRKKSPVQPTYNINETPLESCDTEKDLGVWVSSNLTSDKQVTEQ